MVKWITLILLLLCAAPLFGQTATPVLCPNASQINNNANCQQPPVLAFGKQVDSTASAAETVSYNNCKSTLLTLTSGFTGVGKCTGTGSATLANPTYASISGTDAADFAITGGTCAAGTVVASGSSCTIIIKFTPAAAGARTATLTVFDNTTAGSYTLSLTGTGITSATTLTSSNCAGTLTANTNYQITGNVTCTGSGFQTAGGDDINLQGFTLTYCNTSSTSFVQGIHINGANDTIHNGTISEGAGNCSGLDPQGFWGSGAIEQWVGGGFGGTTAFNLTINVGTNIRRAKVFLDDNGGSDVLHDITYTNSDTYNSANTAGRAHNQGYSILQYDLKTGTGETFYNITGTGGTQGAMSSSLPGNNFSNNLLNPGNASNATTNDFALQIWNSSATVNSNIVTGTGSLNACVTCRGIQIANANGTATMSSVSAQNNTIITTELANNNEYGGCQIGGSYASQYNFTPLTSNTMANNSFTAVSHACTGYGYGDSGGSASNQINNTTIACDHTLVADTQGCHAVRMDNNQYFAPNPTPANITTYTNDTFIGDSGILYIWFDGTGAETFVHPTFSKGPNPVSSGWLLVDNCSAPPTGESGCGSPVNTSGLLTIIDPVFQNGATESATNLTTQGGSASYVIQFTETPTVKNSGGAAVAGATVQFTDANSGTYSCTTDYTGQCTGGTNTFNSKGVIINENLYATAGITHYNNYALQVSATGYTTSNTSALNCTSTNLAACSPTINLVGGPTDLYIGQNSTGTGTGADCSNTLPLVYLATATNWVAGFTYHLCGTITGTAGQTGITVGASGSVGNIITIKFETGAVMTAPYWTAAISATSKNYITIDGGTNGIITNTANGSALANQVGSSGVSFINCSNIEVKNLNISNIYVKLSSENNANGGTTQGVFVNNTSGSVSTISVHDNTIHDAHAGVEIDYANMTGVNVYNNTISNIVWGVHSGDNNASNTISGLNIYNNDICCWSNWNNTGQFFHMDGLILANTNSGSTMNSLLVYNNYIHGPMSTTGVAVNGTALVYLTGNGTTRTSNYVFNNILLVNLGGGTCNQCYSVTIGFGITGVGVYNNTMSAEGVQLYGGSPVNSATVENNIISIPFTAYDFYTGSSFILTDHNVLWTATHIGSNDSNGNRYNTIAAWQGSPACSASCDVNSSLGNPNLNAANIPQSPSSAIGLGVNLTSLGITQLNVGAPSTFGVGSSCGTLCVPRPATGAWDAGAYQSTLWNPAKNGRDYVNGNSQTGKGYSNGVTNANGRRYP